LGNTKDIVAGKRAVKSNRDWIIQTAGEFPAS